MEEKRRELTVNGRVYQVESLLGKGKGGYSYLVRGQEGLRVVKQIHHEPCAYYQFGDKLAAERGDYRRLRETGLPMPELLEVDEKEERLLKEYIEGDTVYALLLSGGMREDYVRQVRGMCALLYPAGLNIDYFPTNFVVSGGKLYYIDYECNQYEEKWDFEHWGVRYWSKTPEFLAYAEEHGDL